MLFVCSRMRTYYCNINLLLVSAHFQLAVMKPEKGLGEHLLTQQSQLSVNLCLSHNIKYNFRQYMTLSVVGLPAETSRRHIFFMYLHTLNIYIWNYNIQRRKKCNIREMQFTRRQLRMRTLYIYIYIYIYVCVCVCVHITFVALSPRILCYKS